LIVAEHPLKNRPDQLNWLSLGYGQMAWMIVVNKMISPLKSMA
jgi:hypothetical protein